MHEWALAQSIVFTALKQKASRVKIALGELQQIDEDVFKLGLEEFSRIEGLEATFEIKKIPASFKCNSCGKEWSFADAKLNSKSAESVHFIPELAHSFLSCPKCKSPDFTIKQGRGCWLEEVY